MFQPGTAEEHEEIRYGGTSEGGRPMARRPGRASIVEEETENDQKIKIKNKKKRRTRNPKMEGGGLHTLARQQRRQLYEICCSVRVRYNYLQPWILFLQTQQNKTKQNKTKQNTRIIKKKNPAKNIVRISPTRTASHQSSSAILYAIP